MRDIWKDHTMNNQFMKTPDISVILTVLNGERYISASIDSILNQTFRNFELIIINDGSTDTTSDIIKSYPDSRIVYLQNETNCGIPKSLNRGLNIARGRYIAIMDADDISMPERFSKQFEFLENNPEVGVCGTWINIIDKNGNFVCNSRYPVFSNVISCFLLFYCCIANPTSMYRKKIIHEIGNYDAEFIAAMDYDLWTRVNEHYRIINLPEFLLNYRIHGGGISQNREKRYHEDYRIRKNAIGCFLGNSLSSEEEWALNEWIKPNSKMRLDDIFLIDNLILKIYKKTLLTHNLSHDELEEINIYFANQAINLAWLSKPISKIASVKLIIRGVKYHPAILSKIFKKTLNVACQYFHHKIVT